MYELMDYLEPIAFGVTGVIFSLIGIRMYFLYSFKKNVKEFSAELVGFRKFDVQHIDPLRLPKHDIHYKDYDYYVHDSRLLLKFTDGGKQYICASEWSCNKYNKKDLGKHLPVRVRRLGKKGPFQVILDDMEHKNKALKERRKGFLVFMVTGLVLILIAVMSL